LIDIAIQLGKLRFCKHNMTTDLGSDECAHQGSRINQFDSSRDCALRQLLSISPYFL